MKPHAVTGAIMNCTFRRFRPVAAFVTTTTKMNTIADIVIKILAEISVISQRGLSKTRF